MTEFPEVVAELVKRFGPLAESGAALTLVYDAGQDSTDNQELMETRPLHFVGSLPPSDHPDLLAVAKSRYRIVDAEAFPGLSAFEARTQVFGRDRRVVVTHSQCLHDAQVRGFEQTLSKARRQLTEITARLGRGKDERPRRRSPPRSLRC